MLVGPKTSPPITWSCKKQGAVSHSSTEAELIALDAGLRTEAIPALTLWNYMIKVFCPDAVAKCEVETKALRKSSKWSTDRTNSSLENSGTAKRLFGDIVFLSFIIINLYEKLFLFLI